MKLLILPMNLSTGSRDVDKVWKSGVLTRSFLRSEVSQSGHECVL